MNIFYSTMKRRTPEKLVNACLDDLPDNIRRDLAFSLYRDVVHEFALFQQGPFETTSVYFAKELCVYIKTRVEPPDEFILRQDEVPESLLYISEGIVRSFVADSSGRGDAEVHYHSARSHLCIEALFVSDGPQLRNICSAVTQKWTSLLVVPRDSFELVIQSVPAWREFVASVRQCVADNMVDVRELADGISKSVLSQMREQQRYNLM